MTTAIDEEDFFICEDCENRCRIEDMADRDITGGRRLCHWCWDEELES